MWFAHAQISPKMMTGFRMSRSDAQVGSFYMKYSKASCFHQLKRKKMPNCYREIKHQSLYETKLRMRVD